MKKGYEFSTAQDWHHYIKIIFNNYKVNKLLEFGLGNGTEYLLDNAGIVMSVEISLGEFNKKWHDQCVKKYASYKNWKPVYMEAGSGIREGHEKITKNGELGNYDKHMIELRKAVDSCGTGWDMIFVDPGIGLRGDLVNLAFGRAPIIVAHDSTRDVKRIKAGVYGYDRVVIPGNYEEIHFEDTYCGTTVWVDRMMDGLRGALKARLGK